MPQAAVLAGAAIVGAGASIISGNKAANAQTQAANTQVAEQRRQYDTSRADLAPWRDVGGSALGKLAGMYGAGGQSGQPNTGGGDPAATGADQIAPAGNSYGGFFTSPGYQWRRDQGVQAVERSAASRGLLGSGAAVKAIGRYADGLASSEYQNFGDRLGQLAGLGQNATNATVAAGQTATAGITNAMQMAGNARASSFQNVGSSINSGINNALYSYLNRNTFSGSKPASSGGGWGGGGI